MPQAARENGRTGVFSVRFGRLCRKKARVHQELVRNSYALRHWVTISVDTVSRHQRHHGSQVAAGRIAANEKTSGVQFG